MAQGFKSGLKRKVIVAAIGTATLVFLPIVTYSSFNCNSCRPKVGFGEYITYVENKELRLRLEELIEKYDAKPYEKAAEIKKLEKMHGIELHGMNPEEEELSSLERVLKTVPNKVESIDFYIFPGKDMGKDEKGKSAFMVTLDAKTICIGRYSDEELKKHRILNSKDNHNLNLRHELAHSWHRNLIDEESNFNSRWMKANKWAYSGKTETEWKLQGVRFEMENTSQSYLELKQAKWGFIEPYGAKDIMEDVATYVEEAYRINYSIFPIGFTKYENSKEEIAKNLRLESQLFTIDFVKEKENGNLGIYKRKFNLLKEYGFISKHEYNEVMKWFNLIPKLSSLSDKELSKLEEENYQKGLSLTLCQ